MVVHTAMPLHLIGFVALAVDPLDLLAEGSRLLVDSSSSHVFGTKRIVRVVFITVTLLFSLILYNGCLSHPFLLSDNRCFKSISSCMSQFMQTLRILRLAVSSQ